MQHFFFARIAFEVSLKYVSPDVDEASGGILVHSIGIDIVDCARIDRLLSRYGQRFIGRILHEQERRDMSLRRDPVPFVAGRFAAKEAAIKALGQYITDRPAWSTILIAQDKQGRPTLDLSEVIGDELGKMGVTISISHERSHAVAIVLLTESS